MTDISSALEERDGPPPKRNSFQFALLMAMNVLGKHVYAGSVTPAEKEKRRKANKVARNSRKKNR